MAGARPDARFVSAWDTAAEGVSSQGTCPARPVAAQDRSGEVFGRVSGAVRPLRAVWPPEDCSTVNV
jgi:hypothetical protein